MSENGSLEQAPVEEGLGNREVPQTGVGGSCACGGEQRANASVENRGFSKRSEATSLAPATRGVVNGTRFALIFFLNRKRTRPGLPERDVCGLE